MKVGIQKYTDDSYNFNVVKAKNLNFLHIIWEKKFDNRYTYSLKL